MNIHGYEIHRGLVSLVSSYENESYIIRINFLHYTTLVFP